MVNIFALLLILAFIGLFCWLTVNLNKPFYPLSRTGKPFDEYDADGYLTPESYQSHIRHYPNGCVEIDTEVLSKTRKYAEDMKACKEISQRLGLKQFNGLD